MASVIGLYQYYHPLSATRTATFSTSLFYMSSFSSFSRVNGISFFKSVRGSRFLTTAFGSFTWEDVLRVSDSRDDIDDGSSDLGGYFEKINKCNRGIDKRYEFVPFKVENQTVGYIHRGFVEHIKKFRDVFTVQIGSQVTRVDDYVALHPSLNSSDERTEAVGHAIKHLGEGLIPGIRDELYPVVSSFGTPPFFSLERAAAPYFGIKAYGVHMNGYVNKGGEKFLWIGKRSNKKPTYPGLLDHLVAGGLPHGISCGDNLLKECKEEAGIPCSISNRALSVGAISYVDIDGYSYKRDVLFCYDLELPDAFIPENLDGEVENFRLISVTQVANIIRRTEYFKPNCCLVIIDFLFRHGYICPQDFRYLDLLRGLRNTELS